MVEDEDEGYDDGYGSKDEANNSMGISSVRGAEVAEDDILDDGVKGHAEVCARQLPDILFFNLVHVVGALLHGVGKERTSVGGAQNRRIGQALFSYG